MFLAFDFVFGELHVSAGCSAKYERHASCIRAILCGDVERVNAVAEGFRKLLAFVVSNDTSKQDCLKRYGADHVL